MENGYSGYYAYINRNKKGITLNLKTEEEKQIFTELLKTADVVCENYKVGVLERLGFSYEKMKEINPLIIYGSISGFGLTGDLAPRPAYDIVAQAMSGMMSVTGFPDGPPCKIGPSIAPFDSFHAKDGDFVMGCGTDKMFAALCDAMEQAELPADARFDTNLHRCENYGILKPIIEAWTETKTVKDLEGIISSLKIPFGEILDIPQAAEHAQTKERNMLWEVFQPGMERNIRIPGTPIKIHGEQDSIQKAAPVLGEDNATVYGMLGYPADTLAAFTQKGVI